MPPLPPGSLGARTPLLEILLAGTELHRFYPASYAPVYFDPSQLGRLNSPTGDYGVLYAARTVSGAFAETFLRKPGSSLIARDFLASKAYVRLVTTRELRLIRFAGPGLARLGATAEVVHSGLPYDVSQTWSAALHAHPFRASGIAYNARHDDEELCYAIFDRARASLREQRRVLDLDTNWFWDVAERYGVGLAP